MSSQKDTQKPIFKVESIDQLTDSLCNVKLTSEPNDTSSALNKTNEPNGKSVSQSKGKDSTGSSASKLPTWTGNGRPSSYKQPSQNYKDQQGQLASPAPHARCDSRLSSIGGNGGGGGGLVPSLVSSVHNSHLAFCPNVRSSNNQNNGNSPAMSETMSVSTISSRCRTQSTKCGGNNETFRFEEYMPLCEVQRLLGKGEIVEVKFGCKTSLT